MEVWPSLHPESEGTRSCRTRAYSRCRATRMAIESGSFAVYYRSMGDFRQVRRALGGQEIGREEIPAETRDSGRARGASSATHDARAAESRGVSRPSCSPSSDRTHRNTLKPEVNSDVLKKEVYSFNRTTLRRGFVVGAAAVLFLVSAFLGATMMFAAFAAPEPPTASLTAPPRPMVCGVAVHDPWMLEAEIGRLERLIAKAEGHLDRPTPSSSAL